MKALSDAGRGHEEFRLRLEKEKEVELETIAARRTLAEAQAAVLSEALRNAKIDIIGGEAQFFDRLAGAIAMGKSVDAFFSRSESARTALQEYLSGGRSLPDDLKEVLSRPGGGGDAQAMALGAVLARLLATGGEGQMETKVDTLPPDVRRHDPNKPRV